MAERAVRLVEAVAVLAAAADLGMGLAAGPRAAYWLIAMRLADLVGLAVDDREDLFYLTLLRMAGCTVESSSMGYHFGDEVRFGADPQALDYGNYQEFGTWVTEHFAADQSERCVNNCWIGFSSTRLRNGVRSSWVTAKWPGWWPWKWASGQHSSKA